MHNGKERGGVRRCASLREDARGCARGQRRGREEVLPPPQRVESVGARRGLTPGHQRMRVSKHTHGRRKIGSLSGFRVVVERMLSMPVGGSTLSCPPTTTGSPDRARGGG